jgi:hypothetical protein
MTLHPDWETKLREAHQTKKDPYGNKKTLNARIKEINKL